MLYLIKKNNVNIYDIPIAEITRQYIEWLEQAQRVQLDGLTEFFLMASQLLYLKSKLLLPVEVDLENEIEDPRKDLVEKLIEYQRIKKLSDLMQEKEAQTQWKIERKKKQRLLPFDNDEAMWERIDVWDLVVSFQTMIKAISSERILDLYESVSINEKIALLDELTEQRDCVSFSDLIVHEGSVMEIICSFLAILDSVKVKKVLIFQNRFFGEIQIRKNPDFSLLLSKEAGTDRVEGSSC